MRTASLESIRVNYQTLKATWEKALTVVRESEVKARINRVAAVMNSFKFLFGLMLAERILKHTDNLSRTIQASPMPAVEARSLSQLCIAVFEKIRTEECFDQFWAFVELTHESLGVSEPILPRQRKRPRLTKSVLVSHTVQMNPKHTINRYIFSPLMELCNNL